MRLIQALKFRNDFRVQLNNAELSSTFEMIYTANTIHRDLCEVVNNKRNKCTETLVSSLNCRGNVSEKCSRKKIILQIYRPSFCLFGNEVLFYHTKRQFSYRKMRDRFSSMIDQLTEFGYVVFDVRSEFSNLPDNGKNTFFSKKYISNRNIF